MVDRPYGDIADALAVNVGLELLKIVPGRVRLSCKPLCQLDSGAGRVHS